MRPPIFNSFIHQGLPMGLVFIGHVVTHSTSVEALVDVEGG